MFKKVKYLISHPLISGSSIIFVGSFIASFIQYLFNLFMGRFLSVSEYGLLVSLMSVITIFAIFQGSLSSIFAKFIAQYKARKDKYSHSMFLQVSFKFAVIFASALFLLLLICTPLFASFLHVDQIGLLVLTFATIGMLIIYSFPIGVLQGEMRFIFLSFLNIFSPVLKIGLGLLAIFLGFQIFGIMVGVFFSFLIPSIIGIVVVFRNYNAKHAKKADRNVLFTEIKKYSYAFFAASLGIALITNGDVILVRNLFPPEVAGQYAALSLMGKAIFYFTTPIYFVFFPLIAYKKERGESLTQTLLLGAAFVGSISLCLSFVYFTFPFLVLKIFFPSPQYKVLAPLLGPFSIFVIFFSIVYLFNNFFLSSGKTGIYKINLSVAAALIVLFFIFHESLMQIIWVLIGISFVNLLLYLVYYVRSGRH